MMKAITTLLNTTTRPAANLRRLATILCLVACCFSCEDFISIDLPEDQLVSGTLFSDNASATSSIIGIYNEMMNTEGFASGGRTSITVLAGLSADELASYSAETEDFQSNSIRAENNVLKTSVWEAGYKYIYYANSVLEGIAASTKVDAATKTQLEGEAKFVRAFCLFYLVNLFGDVPVVTGTDYQVNARLYRSPAAYVYEQIIKDLADAQAKLPPDYSVSKGGRRVRPNKWAATALLARVQLYLGNWSAAEAEASAVIGNNLYTLLPNPGEVFLAGSTEAIWQLMPVVPGNNTYEGLTFIIKGYPSKVALQPSVITAFEAGDKRRTSWCNSVTVEGNAYYYPFKYKIAAGATTVTEYSMVLRLAEQYLIRAEARAQQDNIAGAIADLDAIRHRAGLTRIGDTNPTIQKIALLAAIAHERQIELLAEWGHRWLDLKRTHQATPALLPAKTDWQPEDMFYPIPQSEIENNANLKPQNDGY